VATISSGLGQVGLWLAKWFSYKYKMKEV